jgi:hypothetical protein
MGKVKELMEAQLNESGDIKTAAPIFGKRFVNEVMADRISSRVRFLSVNCSMRLLCVKTLRLT